MEQPSTTRSAALEESTETSLEESEDSPHSSLSNTLETTENLDSSVETEITFKPQTATHTSSSHRTTVITEESSKESLTVWDLRILDLLKRVQRFNELAISEDSSYTCSLTVGRRTSTTS